MSYSAEKAQELSQQHGMTIEITAQGETSGQISEKIFTWLNKNFFFKKKLTYSCQGKNIKNPAVLPKNRSVSLSWKKDSFCISEK